jgi:hypothetical protein
MEPGQMTARCRSDRAPPDEPSYLDRAGPIDRAVSADRGGPTRDGVRGDRADLDEPRGFV